MKLPVATLEVILALAAPALALNAIGHKVVSEIAWQQLDAYQRKQTVDTIKRHPRFAQDFAKDMPAECRACKVCREQNSST